MATVPVVFVAGPNGGRACRRTCWLLSCLRTDPHAGESSWLVARLNFARQRQQFSPILVFNLDGEGNQGIVETSDRLASFIEEHVLPVHGSRLCLVGHSIGGLVCAYYADFVAPSQQVKVGDQVGGDGDGEVVEEEEEEEEGVGAGGGGGGGGGGDCDDLHGDEEGLEGECGSEEDEARHGRGSKRA
eukprot:752559-Hanusia_phi.AAC.1